MTENLETKVDRLLTNNSVQVKFCSEGVISAAVRGDSGIWDIRWSRDQGWECTCPHFGAECSHVQAVRSITMRPVGASR
jgi:hypothetical protein